MNPEVEKFMSAAYDGDCTTVRVMMDDPEFDHSKWGCHAFVEACTQGHLDIVKFIEEKYIEEDSERSDDSEDSDDSGMRHDTIWTGLRWAIIEGNLKVVRHLLPIVDGTSGSELDWCLHLAKQFGRPRIEKLLNGKKK